MVCSRSLRRCSSISTFCRATDGIAVWTGGISVDSVGTGAGNSRGCAEGNSSNSPNTSLKFIGVSSLTRMGAVRTIRLSCRDLFRPTRPDCGSGISAASGTGISGAVNSGTGISEAAVSLCFSSPSSHSRKSIASARLCTSFDAWGLY